MHIGTCISGPIIEQKLHRDSMWGYIVEFTLAVGTPFIFGITRPVSIEPGLPEVVQDVPFNLVPYPSAELASGTVVVSTNYSDNPSVEVNLNNWSKSSTTVVATDVTLLQSDTVAGGLAAAGTKAAKSRFAATNSGTAGTIQVQNQTATFPARVAGDRMSVNVWSVAQLVSGTAVLGTQNIAILWRQGATTLRTDTIPVAAGGGATSSKSVAVPVGTDNVIVRAYVNLTSWSTGAIVDVYADAVAVTVP
jgi:hypothetical protein